MERQILVDVRGEPSAEANHGPWQELLKRYTRGQPIEVGVLV
jgi:hypothetical protein